MPQSIKGWLMFGIAFGVALFVFNNVAFLSNLVSRKA